MGTPIISGNVETQVGLAMAISSDGKEIKTQTQILPAGIGSVESQVTYCIPVDANGNALR